VSTNEKQKSSNNKEQIEDSDEIFGQAKSESEVSEKENQTNFEEQFVRSNVDFVKETEQIKDVSEQLLKVLNNNDTSKTTASSTSQKDANLTSKSSTFKPLINFTVDLTFKSTASLSDQTNITGHLTNNTTTPLNITNTDNISSQSAYYSRGFQSHKLELSRVIKSAAPNVSLLRNTRPVFPNRPIRIVQTASVGGGQNRSNNKQLLVKSEIDYEFKQKWIESETVGDSDDVKILDDKNDSICSAGGNKFILLKNLFLRMACNLRWRKKIQT